MTRGSVPSKANFAVRILQMGIGCGMVTNPGSNHLPSVGWLQMRWERLLFAHWPVPASVLRPLIPVGLELDLLDGQAWLGIVPFLMSRVRLRGLPPIPGTACFPELNVRTYVRHRGQTGVWFFSLDAANPLAVVLARSLYHLAYRHARMVCEESGGCIQFSSLRTDRAFPAADLLTRYRPDCEVFQSKPGTLIHWLTERYSLFSSDRSGGLYHGQIAHAPWKLQKAEVDLSVNTMTCGLGFELPESPALMHYSDSLDVSAGFIRRLSV